MKFLLILCGLYAGSALAWFHYPEERVYTSRDRGYTQYGAPSLHRTGRYSLTFDDGPHPVRTPRILDVLKAHNVKATFFVLTSLINERTFPIIKRMLDEGHIVASHGLSHDNSDQIPREVWKARVKQSFVDLARWYRRAGHDFTKHYYRFPYAVYGGRTDHHHLNTLREISRELMGQNCIHFAFWDIDSGDWIPGMSAGEVAQNLRASHEGGRFTTYRSVRQNGQRRLVKHVIDLLNPTEGGVVLLHDIQESAVGGTESFLRYAAARGLEIVPLDAVEEFAITRDCRL
jgi:peptidoglycan/xylan/chitin deacetylase (PgdA/CDA1 family)